MLCLGCSRHETPPAPQGPKKPRVDLTVWLDGEPQGDPQTTLAISTKAPPKGREMLERSQLKLAVLGVPADVDAQTFLEKAVPEAEAAGANATVVVSTKCAADLARAIEKKIYVYWRVPLVVGASCDGQVKPTVGSAAVVEAGKASRVRIVFDRHTQAFLKVDPIP